MTILNLAYTSLAISFDKHDHGKENCMMINNIIIFIPESITHTHTHTFHVECTVCTVS